MSDEESETASIACEPCRQKKCKCDRKLPICKQCKSSPAKCHYPEKNRRGIPAGYVNALEKRLAESERALFFALAEIHAGTIARDDYESLGLWQTMEASVLSGPTPTTQQEKAELMANWARTPLANRGQAEAWFEENRRGAALPACTDSGKDVARGGVDAVSPITTSALISTSSGRPMAHLYQTSQAGRVSGGAFGPEIARRGSYRESPRQGRYSGRAEPHPEPPSNHGDEGGTPSTADMSQASRASILASANSRLYF